MAEFDITEYEKINPIATVNGVHYAVPNSTCMWRVQSLFTKEPETIEWIATFNKDDILIDVGANVGMYTVWAAVNQGVRVYAFEPESQNYALLCKNIVANNIQDRVTSYCLAISDDTAGDGGLLFDRLNLGAFLVGGSMSSFGKEVDHNLNPRASVFRQGCLCVSIDRFMLTPELISSSSNLHIKIDVDGIEHKVMASAMRTLQNDRVKSVLIELNTNLEVHNELIGIMEQFGFTTSIPPKAIIKDGPLKGIGNHIFKR